MLGRRGSGKSALLELLASKYLESGGKIIDLFGSSDGEGLSWLRSPYAADKNICLLHGDGIEIKGWNNTLPATNFSLAELDKSDIFVSANPLYKNKDDEYDCVNSIVDKLWRRLSWSKPVCVIVREAANLFYSRLKLTYNQQDAKAEMVYLMREARHHGISLLVDSLRYTSIDIDIRSLSDYTFIKNIGVTGLPEELWWIYRTFDPVAIRHLDKNEFILICHDGGLASGTNAYNTWHKETSENILHELNLAIKMPPLPKNGETPLPKRASWRRKGAQN